MLKSLTGMPLISSTSRSGNCSSGDRSATGVLRRSSDRRRFRFLRWDKSVICVLSSERLRRPLSSPNDSHWMPVTRFRLRSSRHSSPASGATDVTFVSSRFSVRSACSELRGARSAIAVSARLSCWRFSKLAQTAKIFHERMAQLNFSKLRQCFSGERSVTAVQSISSSRSSGNSVTGVRCLTG